jgi:hypothetical protein
MNATKDPTRNPHNTHGVAQYEDGRWFSLSEEAFSSGAQVFATRAEAVEADARHHKFMMEHYPNAAGRAPFITRIQ